MIRRRILSELVADLDTEAAVALLGPRQVGKTTLAHEVAAARPSVYLDLADPADRAKLADAGAYLGLHEDKLVVLDEIQHLPELFATLRGLIDRGRRKGLRTGRFLVLGSASMALLRQSSESLAGRIAYRELAPFDPTEIPAKRLDALWWRGGYPESFLARDDARSLRWRRDFLNTYLARDIGEFEPRLPVETIRRLWTMLAHAQGTALNASRLAQGLALTSPTVGRYIDLLVDLLLVRRLPAYHANLGKRLVKAPKIYVRDAGMLHALLAIQGYAALQDHPIVGPSWEGFVVETILSCAPRDTAASYFRSAAGAEIDLVLEFAGGETWAVEIKRSLAPRLERGFYAACEDLKPARRFVVHGGGEAVPLPDGIEAVGLPLMAQRLVALR